MNNQLVAKNELWLDGKNKILSFHFVKNYTYKKFNQYSDFIKYVIWKVQSGYKVQ